MNEERTKETWYDQCIALQQEGELGRAVSGLTELLAVYPDYGLAHLALAVFLQEKGDEPGAIEHMSRACELEAEDPFYFTAFSALAIKCGDHELAEEALMKAQIARFQEQMRKMKNLREQVHVEKVEDDDESTDSDQDEEALAKERELVEERLHEMSEMRKQELAERYERYEREQDA